MQVMIESGLGLKRKLTIHLPKEVFTKKEASKLDEVARTANLPGFRKGKVPKTVIIKRFGASIQGDVIDALIREYLPKAIEEQKLAPVGMPTIESVNPASEHGFEFVSSFEVFPEIALKSLEQEALEQIEVDLTEEDIAQRIEKLRLMRAKWNEVDQAAQKGDMVSILLERFVNGESHDQGKPVEARVSLGDGSVIPEIEAVLIGAKPGEHREATIRLPEGYHDQALTNKQVLFKIEVKTVSKPELPELNDEFAKLFGVGDKGYEGFIAEIRQFLTKDAEKAAISRNKEVVFEKLLSKNEFLLPQILVDQEFHRMKTEHDKAHEHSHDHQHSDDEYEEMKKIAARRIKLGLLFNEIIKTAGLELDRDRLRKFVEDFSHNYRDAEAEAFTKWYFKDPARVQEAQAAVMEEQVLEHLLKSATVSKVKKTYQEMLGNHG